jgi:hydrogenase-4 component F
MVLLLGFFSSAAMPPSGLFVSEFLIFKSIFDAKQILLLIAVLLLLTMIIWSFGKNIFKVLFLPAEGFDESNVVKTNPWESLTQFILLAAAVWLGLNPPPVFVQMIQDSIIHLPQ